MNDEEWVIGAAMEMWDYNSPDKSIALGLTQGDGYWGKMLANGHYTSKRGDLAADYGDFCLVNSLDRHDVKSAEFFIRELKAQKLLDDVEKDFE